MQTLLPLCLYVSFIELCYFFVDSVALTICIFCVQQEPYSTSCLTPVLAVTGILTNPTPTHTQPSTSGLPTTASLTAAQHNFRAE